MKTAEEALKIANESRKEIADKFMVEHPEVIARIEKLIDANKDNVQVYYANDGELAVDTYSLGLALMELGYGVRQNMPGFEISPITIRWAKDSWTTDSSDFTWK